MRGLERSRTLALAALSLFASSLHAAPPSEPSDDLGALAPAIAGEALGAAGKLATTDEALRALDVKRDELRQRLATEEGARRDEGRRARRLAREILIAELHGRALASSPEDLVHNATMRSGLRRMATRTLATHGARAGEAETTRAALAALDVDEARLRGERAVAEAELRLEHETARRRRETFAHIFDDERLPSSGDGGGHARIRVAEAGNDDERDDESFAGKKGSLPLPIQRKCRIKSQRNDDYGGPYLAISSAKGSNVRAVAAGNVAFADELAPYGKLVVIDHGQSYFTVYGGLSRVGVGAGSGVREGAVLGQIEPDVTLVFQIRSGSRTLPPLKWLLQRRRPKDDGAAP
jgi:murein DD-endopeptidase MepM/ murein hydrolase activator NlpD